jgi:hypothetical protein
VCGPRVGVRAQDRLGWRRWSPGGIQLEVRDDRRDPTVSLSGAGDGGEMGRRLAGPAGGVERAAACNCCWAAAQG